MKKKKFWKRAKRKIILWHVPHVQAASGWSQYDDGKLTHLPYVSRLLEDLDHSIQAQIWWISHPRRQVTHNRPLFCLLLLELRVWTISSRTWHMFRVSDPASPYLFHLRAAASWSTLPVILPLKCTWWNSSKEQGVSYDALLWHVCKVSVSKRLISDYSPCERWNTARRGHPAMALLCGHR